MSKQQLAAEIELVETWKIMNLPSYPLELEKTNKLPTQRSIRPSSIKEWKDNTKLKCGEESFTIDRAKLWNQAPEDVKMAPSLQVAKTDIKKILPNNGNLI